MQLTRIAPDRTKLVNLHWSRPAPYEQVINEGHTNDSIAWLYMILGYYGSSHAKLFYVGKVYKSWVSKRLRDHDHRKRYDDLRRMHSRHSFRVSLSAVEIVGRKITTKGIDQIETLIIYAAKETHSLVNQRKWLTHGISELYYIQNHGYRRPLPKEIHLGIFTR